MPIAPSWTTCRSSVTSAYARWCPARLSLVPWLSPCRMLVASQVGVSVTRAMKYHGGPSTFTAEDAQHLLRKKLVGAVNAAEGVHDEFKWHRSILHVWAQSRGIAAILKAELHKMPPELWSECLVMCTVCKDMEGIIFKNEEDFECVEGVDCVGRGCISPPVLCARRMCASGHRC